jgi:hypothetical protein
MLKYNNFLVFIIHFQQKTSKKTEKKYFFATQSIVQHTPFDECYLACYSIENKNTLLTTKEGVMKYYGVITDLSEILKSKGIFHFIGACGSLLFFLFIIFIGLIYNTSKYLILLPLPKENN